MEKLIDSYVTPAVSVGYFGTFGARLLSSGAELKKKWKNLRDSYFREVRRRDMISKGTAPPKRNTYIYYRRLNFLSVITDATKSEASSNGQVEAHSSMSQENDVMSKRPHREVKNKKPKIVVDKGEVDESIEMGYVIKTENIEIEDSDSATFFELKYQIEEENSLIEKPNIIQMNAQETNKGSQQTDEGDSDKLFLLSLLDSFRRIPSHRKSAAKIKMIQLVEEFMTH
ncbi:unnamed protein product [Acanthoscelides obtectus]|uniref:BESS domain-containing protein n=1 Tax=Acanthoscelides obtectus TaxID=200917 RepID=A0A9P0JSV0_ACAOB|nr:unnamed protein product [Acanthoscelides obtectus]CAK1642903.1 hypothetical protein AOBTE_LOCUS13280 [Acanthoscelides obtectus]